MSKIPIATHEGVTNINKIKIRSYSLDNGSRVLNRTQFIKALGRTGKAKGGRKYDKEFELPVFLTAKNLKPFIGERLLENSEPIIFKDIKGKESIGYKADILPMVCNVYLEARQAGVLTPTQLPIAQKCEILIMAFAKVGITALIYEQLGFEKRKHPEALKMLIEGYLTEEVRKWSKEFPDELFYQMDRIYGNPKNKKGNTKNRFHQHLNIEVGLPAIRAQIWQVIALLKTSSSKRVYEDRYKRLVGADPQYYLFEED